VRPTRSVTALLLALAAPAALAQSSTLLIRSDADCTLTVNAEKQGALTAGQAKAVKVNPGEQLIECTTPKARVDLQMSIESGTQKVVNLQLQHKLQAIDSGITTRYSAPGDGTVVDSQTGLQWAQQDNGYSINWNDAQRYCSSLSTAGGAWRLPTMNELAGLYDASGTLTTPCGPWTCKAPSQLRLTRAWFWSSERNGSSEACGFGLDVGDRGSAAVSAPDSVRALCVRRRS
jgi:formylglycine-generating enzyme required for sulfatase activity